MNRSSPLLLVLLAACGKLSADDFVVAYTDATCNLRLQCGDTAQLVFDGDNSLEACHDAYLPEVLAEGEDCVLRAKPAGQCLDELEAMSCPDDGDIDAAIPVICATVWDKCLGGEGGGTTSTGGTTDVSR